LSFFLFFLSLSLPLSPFLPPSLPLSFLPLVLGFKLRGLIFAKLVLYHLSST
jgi:hypothetical protein